MNKKGSIFFGVTIAIFLFSMGVLFMPFIADDITTFRDVVSCSDSSISSGAKLSCLQVDLLMPYFILFFVSLALGIIGGSRI